MLLHTGSLHSPPLQNRKLYTLACPLWSFVITHSETTEQWHNMVRALFVRNSFPFIWDSFLNWLSWSVKKCMKGYLGGQILKGLKRVMKLFSVSEQCIAKRSLSSSAYYFACCVWLRNASQRPLPQLVTELGFILLLVELTAHSTQWLEKKWLCHWSEACSCTHTHSHTSTHSWNHDETFL